MVTMGSLFSGFGGFEIAAGWYGVKVLWQSEIEPWAVELLKTNFPEVKQLGNVTDINGAKIEPVDIITFGSPCQDMSVAGCAGGGKGPLFQENKTGALTAGNDQILFSPILALNERQYALTVTENIANTITATDYKGAQVVFIPVEISYIVRRLTPTECAKLQGFPEDWHKGIVNGKNKPISDSAAYKGYGNAVATVCAEYPIQGIVEILEAE